MRNKPLAAFYLFLVFSAEPLYACAVCFGDPNSKSAKALLPAVLFLGAAIVGLLIWIAVTGIVWGRRAKKLYGNVLH